MALTYILDGYNLIKCVDALADLSLQEGRSALLKILNTQRPQGSSRNRVEVIFDGKADVWGSSPSGIAKVVFTSGESADEYIKKRVEQMTDQKNAVVVTNDREIACYVRKLGARVQSVNIFLHLRQGSKKRAGKGRGGNQSSSVKQISRAAQQHINKELEGVWIHQKES